MELNWWMQNLDLNNRRYILSTVPQIVIQSDVRLPTSDDPTFKSGWGSSVSRAISWEPFVTRGKKRTYQLLEF